MTTSPSPSKTAPRSPLLLAGVVALSLFLSGFCGIISELSLFNLAETLLGGTNTNLTYTMGLMMFAMGMGAALSAHRLFQKVSVEMFILVEFLLSLLTMSSVVLIFTLSGWFPGSAKPLIWVFSPLIGLLVGLEIPLVLRINESLGLRLRVNAAVAMAPDYLGSLVAFAGFSFILLPAFGLGHVAWVGGALNLMVAGLVAAVFSSHLKRARLVWAGFSLLLALTILMGWAMPGLMARAEQLHFRDGVVVAKETPYQRLVITDRKKPGHQRAHNPMGQTRGIVVNGAAELRESTGRLPFFCQEDIRLFINGGLQFSTCDEHRYHEMLVHPAVSLFGQPVRALVLGGGDGMAIRELLKHPLKELVLVELDPEMVRLFRDDPLFARLSGGALSDARVRVQVRDAYRFLRETSETFDLILMDFPDPHRTATARLYSLQFFQTLKRALAKGGVVATQSMSPLFHPMAFLSVRKTMEAAGFHVVSLQLPMLTFEHWGFQVGTLHLSQADMEKRLDAFSPTVPTRYLNREAMQAARRWEHSMPFDAADIPVNDQFRLPLLQLYRGGAQSR